jgi:ABC-type sugar transport system substrate-binding protein
VIDDIVCPNKAFHIGPDDYGIGRLAAKLVDLFIKSKGKVLIFSPLYMTSRMPLRAQGFKDKMSQDCPGIDVADIWYINGECEQEYYSDTYAKTMKAIQEIPDLRAIYVSNGLTEWVAKAVEDTGNKGKIVVIGHEYTSGVKRFLENGIIGATIYQNPTQQFHMGIKLLYEIMTGNHSPDGRNLVTNCNIIMNETVPFSRFGGLEYF